MLKPLLILLILTSTLFANNYNYLPIDEFFKHNPDEEKRYEKLQQVVKEAPRELAIKQERPVKISMIYPGIQMSDYWQRSRVSFTERMDELGIDYEIENYYTKAVGEDIQKEAKAIREAVSKGADYLIFTLEIEQHSRLISQILNKQTPKLILQNITTKRVDWGENQPFMYVGFDHQIGSEKLAEAYFDLLGKKGSYFMLYGPKGYISYERGDKFIKYVKENSDIKLLGSYYTTMDRDNIKNAVKNMLKGNPNPDFIYALRTDMALGAIEALKEEGRLDDIIINGWGGTALEMEALQRDELDLTVMRINDDNGIAMAEAIKMDLEGKEQDVPLIFSGEFAIVDKNTPQKRVNELLEQSFRYSNRVQR